MMTTIKIPKATKKILKTQNQNLRCDWMGKWGTGSHQFYDFLGPFKYMFSQVQSTHLPYLHLTSCKQIEEALGDFNPSMAKNKMNLGPSSRFRGMEHDDYEKFCTYIENILYIYIENIFYIENILYIENIYYMYIIQCIHVYIYIYTIQYNSTYMLNHVKTCYFNISWYFHVIIWHPLGFAGLTPLFTAWPGLRSSNLIITGWAHAHGAVAVELSEIFQQLPAAHGGSTWGTW